MSLHRLIAFGSQPDVYYQPTYEEMQSALTQLRTARKAFYQIDYWFDTDAEILDAMSRDELADHDRMRGIIKEALEALE